MINEKEHAFKKFNNDLKEENIKNVILLYGKEEYLRKWAFDSLVDRYINISTKSMDLVNLYDTSTSQEIIESCETFSMFSNKRIVYVRDYQSLVNDKTKGLSNEELIGYIENPNKDSFLIFDIDEINEKTDLVKTILKCGSIYNFDTLDESTLASFSIKYFKKQGLTIEKETLRYFIYQTGYFYRESEYRLYNLVNDIVKISAYSNGEIVTKQDIDKVLVGEEDTFVFNFLDAISNNKKDRAFEMLHSILRESDIFSIVALLINQFELMLEILEFKKEGMDFKSIVVKLKMNEFRIKKAMQASEKFEIQNLKDILSKLYEIDRNIKMGLLDGELALDLIIADM